MNKIITLGATLNEDKTINSSCAYFHNSEKVAFDINGACALLTSCADKIIDLFDEQDQQKAQDAMLQVFPLMVENRYKYLEKKNLS